MLKLSDLPKRDGIPVGQYRLRRARVSESYPGVNYKHGVSVRPVKGRAIVVQRAAFGDGLVIEPWDAATAELVLELAERKGRPATAARVREWLRVERSEAPDERGEPSKEEVVNALSEFFDGVRDIAERGEPTDSSAEPGVDELAEGAADDDAKSTIALAELTRDELLALADDHGVDVDRRWGEKKLRGALEEAGLG